MRKAKLHVYLPVNPDTSIGDIERIFGSIHKETKEMLSNFSGDFRFSGEPLIRYDVPSIEVKQLAL